MSLNIKKLGLPEGQATEITREFGRIYDIGGIEDNHITPEYLSNVLTLSKGLFDEKRLGYLSNNIEKFLKYPNLLAVVPLEDLTNLSESADVDAKIKTELLDHITKREEKDNQEKIKKAQEDMMKKQEKSALSDKVAKEKSKGLEEARAMFGLFPQGIVAPEHIGPGIQDDSTPMEIKNPEYPNVADALKALEELNKKEEQEKLALKEIEDKDLEVVFEEISDKFSIVKNLKSKSVQIRIALADVSKKGNYRILESDNFIKTTFSDILVSGKGIRLFEEELSNLNKVIQGFKSKKELGSRRAYENQENYIFAIKSFYKELKSSLKFIANKNEKFKKFAYSFLSVIEKSEKDFDKYSMNNMF